MFNNGREKEERLAVLLALPPHQEQQQPSERANHQSQGGETKKANPFLRSWVWKREHR
jgi:hypothetical protein